MLKKKGVEEYKKANEKADKAVDAYLEKHMYPKLNEKCADTFPTGISQEKFTELLAKKANVLRSHIFHIEFVEQHLYWKLEK